jgi:hypothetical protein
MKLLVSLVGTVKPKVPRRTSDVDEEVTGPSMFNSECVEAEFVINQDGYLINRELVRFPLITRSVRVTSIHVKHPITGREANSPLTRDVHAVLGDEVTCLPGNVRVYGAPLVYAGV